MKKEGRKKQARSNKQHVHLPIKTLELHVSRQEFKERVEEDEKSDTHVSLCQPDCSNYISYQQDYCNYSIVPSFVELFVPVLLEPRPQLVSLVFLVEVC